MFVICLLTLIFSSVTKSVIHSNKQKKCISLPQVKVSQIPLNFSQSISVHSQLSHYPRVTIPPLGMKLQNHECWQTPVVEIPSGAYKSFLQRFSVKLDLNYFFLKSQTSG